MYGIRIFDNKIINSNSSYWGEVVAAFNYVPAYLAISAVPKDYINDFDPELGRERDVNDFCKRRCPFP